MDFQELINHADYNAVEVKYQGGVKRYSSVLPPPKKVPKANVQSENIKRFLEKRKAEEQAKLTEARKEKEKLLALRAQSSKNNKKAKIMASRTKDNDFSKIKLTDDEVEAKKRRENALLKKNLADKVERMKARIEMEEKEMAMPRKRKRKSKNGERVENIIDYDDEKQNGHEESHCNIKSVDDSRPQKNKVHKPKPPAPAMSFMELLKIAEKRQVEPVEIVIKKKEEEKLLTKKERKLMEEELARKKRKQERLLQAKNSSLSKPSNSVASSKKNISETGNSKNPVVIHVEKDVSKSDPSAKFKIPKGSANTPTNKVTLPKHKDISSNINSKSISKPKDITSNVNSKSSSNFNSSGKASKSNSMNEHKKIKSGGETRSSHKDAEIKHKVAVPKKNVLKSDPVQTKQEPKFDEAALAAKIEQQLREKFEKEMEEKMAATFAKFQNAQPKVTEKLPEPPKQIKKESTVERNTKKKVIENSSGIFKKDMEKMIAMRKQAMEKTILKPKPPEKKPFHKNPYLDSPRRLLESRRPPRPPMKRRMESDDDDDDDDMSDFIDDGPSQNDEDYSKYIKEIFGYDRNRYLDDDEDDIMETSFAEQMKEEVRSAKLGYLEDLEEEKLENERKKRKKKKK